MKPTMGQLLDAIDRAQRAAKAHERATQRAHQAGLIYQHTKDELNEANAALLRLQQGEK